MGINEDIISLCNYFLNEEIQQNSQLNYELIARNVKDWLNSSSNPMTDEDEEDE
jgi:hypothetical protein